MAYTINANAKNVWIRDNENTRDLSIQTDASSVYLDNGRTLEQELGEGSMVSNVATVDSAMSKIIDGTLDGAYESGVMYGRSLVNLFDKTKIQPHSGYSIGEDNTITYLSYQGFGEGVKLNCLKPNTKYALFFNVLSTSLDPDVPYRINDDGTNYGINIFGNKQDAPSSGYHSFVTGDNVDNVQFRFYTNERNEGYKLTLPVILKYQEGMENWDVSFFEGLCDVKMPILRNVGKNLLDINTLPIKVGKDICQIANGVVYSKPTTTYAPVRWIVPVEPNTTYTLSAIGSPDVNLQLSNFYNTSDSNLDVVLYYRESVRQSVTFTTTTHTNITMSLFSALVKNLSVWNIQLEKESVNTTYEDYKTNILCTSEEIILRSLPNGVQDTYNPLTGEYIKRIGEVVLDGSSDEEWGASGYNGSLSNIGYIQFYLSSFRQVLGNTIICDSLVIGSSRDWEDMSLQRKFINLTSAKDIGVRIPISLLNTNDLNGFKQWLSHNPITVQYQLATPITTTIDPIGIPFAYQNGHVILESGYEGQSLLPTLEYSTVVNRTGQVESVTKTIQTQEKQLTMLEQMLIQNIIGLDYNNTVLALNLEIDEVM